jgi:hypothetical protein
VYHTSCQKTRYMGKIGPRYSHVSDPVLQLALFVSDMKLFLFTPTPRGKNNANSVKKCAQRNRHHLRYRFIPYRELSL